MRKNIVGFSKSVIMSIHGGRDIAFTESLSSLPKYLSTLNWQRKTSWCLVWSSSLNKGGEHKLYFLKFPDLSLLPSVVRPSPYLLAISVTAMPDSHTAPRADCDICSVHEPLVTLSLRLYLVGICNENKNNIVVIVFTVCLCEENPLVPLKIISCHNGNENTAFKKRMTSCLFFHIPCIFKPYLKK